MSRCRTRNGRPGRSSASWLTWTADATHRQSRVARRRPTTSCCRRRESLDEEALTALGFELEAVSDLLLQRGSAAAHAVRDHAGRRTPGRASPSRLLSGKIGDPALSVRQVRRRAALVVLARPAGSDAPGEPHRDVPAGGADRRARRGRGPAVPVLPDRRRLARALGDPGRPDRRPGLPGQRWSTGCWPAGPTRWSPNWSTRWPGTPPAARSPTACGELVDQAAQRQDKIVAIVKTAVAADRRADDPAGRLARPDLRPRGLRARRGRTVGASAGSGCRSATK